MKTSVLFLRIGIAFSFIYAAIAGYMNPTAWIGFFPPAVKSIAPAATLIGIWGIIEVLLALVLLFKKNVFYPSLLAAILLFGVTIANWGAMDIVFRDVSIGFAVLAFAFLTRHS